MSDTPRSPSGAGSEGTPIAWMTRDKKGKLLPFYARLTFEEASEQVKYLAASRPRQRPFSIVPVYEHAAVVSCSRCGSALSSPASGEEPSEPRGNVATIIACLREDIEGLRGVVVDPTWADDIERGVEVLVQEIRRLSARPVLSEAYVDGFISGHGDGCSAVGSLLTADEVRALARGEAMKYVYSHPIEPPATAEPK